MTMRHVIDPIRRRRAQRGVSMVEVMVALVIAAFGLIGLAGLQITGLRYQKVAAYHGLASQYAAEMADRMRGNIAAVRAGSYNLAQTNYAPGEPAAPATRCDQAASNCTPAQMAAFDVYAWRLNLARGIPGGWGEISGNSVSGYVVRVYYQEPEVDRTSQANDVNCRNGAVPAQYKNVHCFVTVVFP
ncbi:type IV pilus modification protein PilV [Massilia sp. W12]|uniref:type IV pilus modification protein PilV n=1 Tax=Massilia sp. W12 TaxID=3126507 RepID=UPI0030D26B13